MTPEPKKLNSPTKRNLPSDNNQSGEGQNRPRPLDSNDFSQKSEDIVTTIVKRINSFNTGLKEYQIRDLVNETEKLGKKLFDKKLKTAQIRKFLDAINQLNAQLKREKDFEKIKPGIELLRPQLAYAEGRQQSLKEEQQNVKYLRSVMEAAIKKIEDSEDFTRLVQLIESIIAYHKAAGGKE
ncbi:MAG: type III-A CRISPR-associated protein Csm2 [Microcoleus sp. CAN_BIN18]|nr:type III-A CRISPR-associated protein Csm2 [Microcoleus sp. CAN_BIN18]